MITYDRLKLIIPPDQALANKALQVSLQQIKNISTTSLPSLGAAYSALETTSNLDQINSLTQAVPTSVVDFYANTYATGSGINGTLLLTDVIGAAVGVPYTVCINNNVSTINSLEDLGALNPLIAVYGLMRDTVNGVYGNAVTGPVIIPAAGTYSNATVAFTTFLVPTAKTVISAVVSAYPNSVANLNSESNYMASSLVLEADNQTEAGIDITLSNPSRAATMSFVQSLPSYGNDTTENGPAWYLEQVALSNTLGGQSIIGSMREGRNIEALSAAGIGQDTAVPSNSPTAPPQANLIPSTTSSRAAANSVVQ
jgi:hypothetical protein